MMASLHPIDGILAVSEAPRGRPPCDLDPGAADFTVGGTGLSAREWGVVTFMLLAVLSASVGGFALRGWVDEPVHQSCTFSWQARR